MQRVRISHLLGGLAAVVALTAVSTPLQAQPIQLDADGVTYTFDTAPPSGEISTESNAGGGADILNQAALDAAVNQRAASEIGLPLGSSATNPPSTNAIYRHNTTNRYIQSRPTGNAASLLLLTVQNATGAQIPRFDISFTLGTGPGDAGYIEEIQGQRIYYSTTGDAFTWQPLGTFSTPGPVNIAVPGPIAPDSITYVLFADDNGDGGSDPSWTIDNMVIAVPEPGAMALLGLVGMGLLARRR